MNKYGYKLVDELTPENYKMHTERGLDMMWFGLKAGDASALQAVKEGVKD